MICSRRASLEISSTMNFNIKLWKTQIGPKKIENLKIEHIHRYSMENITKQKQLLLSGSLTRRS